MVQPRDLTETLHYSSRNSCLTALKTENCLIRLFFQAFQEMLDFFGKKTTLVSRTNRKAGAVIVPRRFASISHRIIVHAESLHSKPFQLLFWHYRLQSGWKKQSTERNKRLMSTVLAFLLSWPQSHRISCSMAAIPYLFTVWLPVTLSAHLWPWLKPHCSDTLHTPLNPKRIQNNSFFISTPQTLTPSDSMNFWEGADTSTVALWG